MGAGMMLLLAGGRDLPRRINRARKNKSPSLPVALRYRTAPFIPGFQHTPLIQANPFPTTTRREGENCSRDQRGLFIRPQSALTGKKQRDDFICQGAHQLAVVLRCSLGPEGKEAAPPTDLPGELRKEKLITSAELRPSHQPRHFCILTRTTTWCLVATDGLDPGSASHLCVAAIAGGCGAGAGDGVGAMQHTHAALPFMSSRTFSGLQGQRCREPPHQLSQWTRTSGTRSSNSGQQRAEER